MRTLAGAGRMDANRSLAQDLQREQLRQAREKRTHRLLLGLAELAIGSVGFWLVAEVAGWKLAAGFFLVGWAANIRTKRIST